MTNLIQEGSQYARLLFWGNLSQGIHFLRWFTHITLAKLSNPRWLPLIYIIKAQRVRWQNYLGKQRWLVIRLLWGNQRQIFISDNNLDIMTIATLTNPRWLLLICIIKAWAEWQVWYGKATMPSNTTVRGHFRAMQFNSETNNYP